MNNLCFIPCSQALRHTKKKFPSTIPEQQRKEMTQNLLTCFKHYLNKIFNEKVLGGKIIPIAKTLLTNPIKIIAAVK